MWQPPFLLPSYKNCHGPLLAQSYHTATAASTALDFTVAVAVVGARVVVVVAAVVAAVVVNVVGIIIVVIIATVAVVACCCCFCCCCQ